jgi:rubredoxin
MPFVEADPALMLKAIEGYQNELLPEKEQLDAFYRQFRCKRCGEKCWKEIVRGHCFSDPEVLIPRAVLRCSSCNFLFDPHSGLALEMGNWAPLLVSSEDGSE